MKLPLTLLSKLIELPVSDVSELRHLFDDIGLEVKDLEENQSGAIFNIETLANRGDHLHALGIAREVSARLLCAVKYPALASELPGRPLSCQIRKNTDLCTRYAALEMHIAKNLQARNDLNVYLTDGGGNHPLVDILNYITLEIGQPMHAFDRDLIEGDISVELSKEEIEIRALDNKAYKVPKGSILIKDKKKVLAVGGVIGCENSKVTDSTKKVLIESAAFDPVTIRKTARAMGISTEASFAFERGTDPDGVVTALKRLLYLIAAPASKEQETTQATGYNIVEGARLERPIITLELDFLRKQMNLARLDAVEVTARLKNLGFAVQFDEATKAFKIQAPSWRTWDVADRDDMVEEVARSFSFSKVKLELPALSYEVPEQNQIEKLLEKTEASLLGCGFIEVISKGFYSRSELELIGALDTKLAADHLSILNAVDSDYSHLKATNILHLAKIAEQNHRKGMLSVKIYELCRLFSRQPNNNNEYKHERDVLTFALSGRWNEHEWQKPESREELIAYFKATVESVVKSCGHNLQVIESKESLLHPGCQAAVKIGRAKCGFFGMLHPLIKEKMELKNDLFYCEFDASRLAQSIKSNQYSETSEYPAVKRDITLKIALQESAGKALALITDIKPENLAQAVIFDHFKKPEENFRRVTYRLTFQSDQRTLESAEVDKTVGRVISELSERQGIHLI